MTIDASIVSFKIGPFIRLFHPLPDAYLSFLSKPLCFFVT